MNASIPPSQSLPKPYCAAGYWLPFKGRRYPILPWVGVRYFLVVLCLVCAAIGALELRLAYLARHREVVSNEWEVENKAIQNMNAQKVTNKKTDPIWRTAGMPAPGPKGQKHRIMVVGDSFVWGDGHTNANEIWWRQLEMELHRRGYWNVEVVAVGVNNSSTQEELDWLQNNPEVVALNPDLILLGYVTNDPDMKRPDGSKILELAAFAGNPKPRRFIRSLSWIRKLRVIIPNVSGQILARAQDKARALDQARGLREMSYTDWELELLKGENFAAYSAMIADFGNVIKASKAPHILVTLPHSAARDYFEPRYAPILPLFTASGFEVYDLLEPVAQAFQSERYRGLLFSVNPANGHPGSPVMAFYAARVADRLERDHAQILGPRGPKPKDLVPRINDWLPTSLAVAAIAPATWEFEYMQSSKDPALRLPLGEPHALLSFERPVAMRSLSLEGASLSNAQVYLAVRDPETGAPKTDLIPLGERAGTPFQWVLPESAFGQDVMSLRIVAKFRDSAVDERKLRLQVQFDEDAVRP